ncbi:MAG: glutamate racemase [Patescibacteria group bacterium]|nr:glutamate racemase [Patescibacteria group bacterium]
MKNNNPIGVFDSGVGGLSVLIELKKLLPKENYIFFADQANVPYGAKTGKELKVLVSKIIDFLESKNAKMIVFACNTASVYTIEAMRKKYKTPLVGVVPVIKTLALNTKNKKVGVLSTPATSKSPYLKKLIKEYAKGLKIINIGGHGWEELVEKGIPEGIQTDKLINKNLKSLISERVDCIGLGCTHYPFLKQKIKKIVGPKVRIFDSGEAVAKRVKQILFEDKIFSEKNMEDRYYSSGDPMEFKRVAEKLLPFKLKRVLKATI